MPKPTLVKPSCSVSAQRRVHLPSSHCHNGTCPMNLQALCGMLRPSAGHAKRICKILGSELCLQARLFKDMLKISCASDPHQNQHVYCEWCKTTDHTVEFLQNIVRPSLQNAANGQPAEGKLFILGDITVDPQQEKTIRLGPKFGLETGQCCACPHSLSLSCAGSAVSKYYEKPPTCLICRSSSVH